MALLGWLQMNFRRITPTYYRRPNFVSRPHSILFLEDKAIFDGLVHSVRFGKPLVSRA